MFRYHIMASGHVQGVGFRVSCQREATKLGLTGFAKNLADGRVEIEVQGEDDVIKSFTAIIQDIPPGSQAALISEQIELKADEGFDIF